MLNDYYCAKFIAFSNARRFGLKNYFIQGLTNWGRDDIVSDLTPDEDSIQVTAYFQICSTPSVVNAKVGYDLTANTVGATLGSGSAYTYLAEDEIQIANSVKYPVSWTLIILLSF